ncbi:MAG: hypothetical protein NVS1B7_5850 [Candidatus Saccharimonadales bacterium]
MTYSSSLAMGRQRYTAQGRNTTVFKSREKTLGPISNTIMLIVLACLLGLLYLTQVTKTNVYSYRINTLQEQKTSLISEHDDLSVNAARLQALERVKASTVNKNLVAITPSTTIQN